ncbi:MAG TPA: TIGR00341 family protein [Sediminibacterium sp.]|nr:TIGR00341 family protein [Sediminibacterium sp.]
MSMNIFTILRSFRLMDEKEDYQEVVDNIEKGVVFRGTNLWILIFAIFIASLGLNVNSTAVIIGAMLISPLMGPIIGLGLSLGINDLRLLRKSAQNYFFAVVSGLITSTIYFLLSPINDAHSEILARTQPNIYDVLIAFFGGLAGILALSSKQKGNVIPGVAIATALMPPLCTAGYGLATLQWKYFGGAFYLFLINTVFIALATLITVRYLRFPTTQLVNSAKERNAQRIIWVITLLTVLPSIYFGYAFIQDNRFIAKANAFIETEAKLPDEYLLNKKIDASGRQITLTYGGAPITEAQLADLQQRFQHFGMGSHARLEIKQGFSYLDRQNEMDKAQSLLSQKDMLVVNLQNRIDTLTQYNTLGGQIYKEIKINYPTVHSLVLTHGMFYSDSTEKLLPICLLEESAPMTAAEESRLETWLRVRLRVDTVALVAKQAPLAK